MCLVMSLEFVMGEQIEWSNKRERKTVTWNNKGSFANLGISSTLCQDEQVCLCNK